MIGIGGYFIWRYFHPVQPVTVESQEQAETPAGISLAAHNAKVGMMQEQLDSAAQQIAELKNKKPDIIIKTVPVEVPKVVTQEVEKRGADFGIITDPKQPNNPVDLKEITKLPNNTDITLNQYNVFAYKEKLCQLDIDFNIAKTKVNEVDYSESHKISKDGKYLGYVAGYDFDDKKAKIGLRYTF